MQKVDDVLDDRAIFLSAHLAHAGCQTLPNMIVETGTVRSGQSGEVVPTIPNGEGAMQQVHHLAGGDAYHIGAEIARAVRSEPSYHGHLGIILSEVYAQKRIEFIVFQEDIVVGFVLLDERILEHQSVYLTIAYDIVKIRHFVHQGHGLLGLGSRVFVCHDAFLLKV